MTSRPSRRERIERRDYTPAVRSRGAPPGLGDQGRVFAPGDSPFVVELPLKTRFLTFDGDGAAGSDRRSLIAAPGNGLRTRLVKLEFWAGLAVNANTVSHYCQVYWGTSDIAAVEDGLGSGGKQLFYEPLDSINEKHGGSWSVGRGPVGPLNGELSIKLNDVGPAGQDIFALVWYTVERG